MWIPAGRKAGAVLMIFSTWDPQNPPEPEKNKFLRVKTGHVPSLGAVYSRQHRLWW